ncbi:hypothetical protein EH183_41340 [Streptomyces sp. CB01881]|uniref:hypothetical protein n=1 Tax=Streptomyces sp. CB01881 TaxID=2078691 RepID=UPI0011E03295|nr:hypothetical protein [Streptomyces sp. CB01881]TYC66659.1 hypothetical protein EH183_41340 [Streptomyces sp. CB01881]
MFNTADGRRVIVATGDGEHRHSVRLYGPGAWLATGATSEPAAVVLATAAWTGGAGLERTRAAAPFIHCGDWTLTREREPLDEVEPAWWFKLESRSRPSRTGRPRRLIRASNADLGRGPRTPATEDGLPGGRRAPTWRPP